MTNREPLDPISHRLEQWRVWKAKRKLEHQLVTHYLPRYNHSYDSQQLNFLARAMPELKATIRQLHEARHFLQAVHLDFTGNWYKLKLTLPACTPLYVTGTVEAGDTIVSFALPCCGNEVTHVPSKMEFLSVCPRCHKPLPESWPRPLKRYLSWPVVVEDSLPGYLELGGLDPLTSVLAAQECMRYLHTMSQLRAKYHQERVRKADAKVVAQKEAQKRAKH